MITLHNFSEAYYHYRKRRLPYRLLQDQAAVLINALGIPGFAISEALDVSESIVDSLIFKKESSCSYSEYLGGNVYICELYADLMEIKGCDFEWAENHEGKWPNVTDIPLSWDACEYLPEPNGEPQWAMFLLCWNNAGGPVYYVPKNLWVEARVTEHIKATNSTS